MLRFLQAILRQGTFCFQEMARAPHVHLEWTSLGKKVGDSLELGWESPV